MLGPLCRLSFTAARVSGHAFDEAVRMLRRVAARGAAGAGGGGPEAARR